jgi:AcrR family transcriptional regulator
MSEERDAQRNRVLDVAVALFAKRGFDDVSMTEIAEAANVARATVFNYFGSKHALIEAITETILHFYRDMLDEALADDLTPTPTLVRDLFEGMALGIESQRGLFRSVFREIARIQLGFDEGGVAQRANEETTTRLELLFDRGKRRGELTDAFDAATLASAMKSLSNGTITHWLYDDPTGPLSTRMRDAADIFLSPVACTPARNPRSKRGAK